LLLGTNEYWAKKATGVEFLTRLPEKDTAFPTNNCRFRLKPHSCPHLGYRPAIPAGELCQVDAYPRSLTNALSWALRLTGPAP
jgi:hypothetical protein